MKKIAVLFTIIGAVLLGSGLQAADTGTPVAEQPKYTAGDNWVFMPTNEADSDAEATKAFHVTFVSQDEAGYNFTKDGVPYKRDKFLSPVTDKAKGFPGPVLQFPFKVGSYWSQDYEGGKVGNPKRMTAKYSVEAYEQITVPAGTFWAYRIEVSRVLASKREGGVYGNSTYWYAPAAKNIIKSRTVVLKEYKIQ